MGLTYVRPSLSAEWVLLSGALALSAVTIACCASLWLEGAGVNYGLVASARDYGLGLALAFLLLAVTFVLPIPRAHRLALSIVWLARLTISLGPSLYFDAAYYFDAIYFFHQGISIEQPLSNAGFGKGTQNVIALVSLLSHIVGDSYFSIKVIFAWIGCLSAYIFFRALSAFTGSGQLTFLYVLGLTPSLAFWSSGLGKDSITLLGLSLFALGAVRLLRFREWRGVALCFAGLVVSAGMRVWLGVILLVPIAFSLIMTARGRPVTRVLAVAMISVGLVLVLSGFADRFGIDSLDDVVQTTDRLSQSWARGGSAQELGGFQSLAEMVIFLPLGTFTALFRPLPGEVMNPFGLLGGLENMVILLATLHVLTRMRVSTRDPVVIWGITTIIVWAALYSFVSYQNLGTALRYKVQILPFILMMLAPAVSRLTPPGPGSGVARRPMTSRMSASR